MKTLLLVLAACTWSSSVWAQGKAYIPVGQAKTKKTVIAYTDSKPMLIQGNPDPTDLARTIRDTAMADLTFMEIFKFMDRGAFIEDKSAGLTPDKFKLSDWTSIGAEFLVKSKITRDANTLTFEAYVYDTFGAKQLLAKKYVATVIEAKIIGHSLANDIVEVLTGLRGIFTTKITMSCDRRSNVKEIYVMNFDGSEVKQITSHRSIALAPGWSPDSSKIAYSLFTKRRSNNIKNIDLYEYNFNTNTIRMLSNRQGINSGAAYSPDGKRIALTMSFLGNPEIFSFDPNDKTVTRLTKSLGEDVDPAWSPDGKELAFVSTRSGKPMVFAMNLAGGNIRRLTFAGDYNATPTWSPTNNKIAFAGWIDGMFDIFIMNPDGTNIERLTKNQGNNEDPHFSPDGNFITFSSNRTGEKNIYVMNVDGTFVKRLTYGLGNCVAPKWSQFPVKPRFAEPKK
ncbi:MAG: PD40 domain-containing protein [Bdellovibrionales bacterium]|nr:PD40 domain-containing protein [Bdellovibrionales bacterium]